MADGKTISRRGLLLGAAGLSAVAWGWQRFGKSTPEMAFAPIPGLSGWRQLETRAISSGGAAGAVFLGIGEDEVQRLPPDALCDFLYPVRQNVAFFTDIQCPNCRSLDAKLLARSDHIALNRIELPLLGPRSETHARATIARQLNIEPDSAEITAELARSFAAAETLGIWGTPAMTIGRTLVMGDVPGETLDALLAMDHPACRHDAQPET